ncbi:MAG: HNH endonuclease [Pseudomonadota bacterium]
MATRTEALPGAFSQQDGLADAIHQSPRMALQRAVGQGIQRSAPMAAQRAQMQLLGGPPGAEEIPASDEAELENAAARASWAGEQAAEGDDGDAAGEEGDEQAAVEEGEDDADPAPVDDGIAQARAAQGTVAQLGRGKSNRIASYQQIKARNERKRRKARSSELVRFVPGARPRTALRPGGAVVGGGQVLSCPLGTYLRRVKLAYTGSRAGDIVALGGTPPGFVWHHHHDYVAATNIGTMMLLPIADHKPGHRGGVWQWEHSPGHGVYG